MYREEVILPLVDNNVDHCFWSEKQKQGIWLHSLVKERSKSCLGVDILDVDVQRINHDGDYNFLTANVEHLPFVEEFEVVLAGEIVEHIYNMGLFLDSAWRALLPAGTLIITTPDRFSISTSIPAFLLGQERCHPEHTCYYSPQTLSYIVSRHGFKVERIALVDRPSRRAIIGQMRSLICILQPILADQIVMVATKQQSQGKYNDKW